MSREYSDERITCDADGITISKYYFPIGDKRILYEDILSVQRHDMGTGVMGGRWRIWGSGDFKHWFHLDTDRPNKRYAFVLELGVWARPVITPRDPDRFVEVVEQHGVSVKLDG